MNSNKFSIKFFFFMFFVLFATSLSAASISGTVFTDTDANGVQDGGETGIADVRVRLYRDVNNDGYICPDVGDYMVTAMDADGNGDYSFTGISDGNYAVWVMNNDTDIPTGSRLNSPNPADATVNGTLNIDFAYLASSIPAGYTHDYGDAPDTYPGDEATTDDARHRIVDGFHLGNFIDADGDGTAEDDVNSPDALADDNSNNDDEDGVQLLDPLIPGQNARVRIFAKIGTVPPDNAKFLGYFDLDGNNNWYLDEEERLISTTGIVDGINDFTISIPLDATNGADGKSFARFKYTDNRERTGTCCYQEADTGEVEDYEINIGTSYTISGTAFNDEDSSGAQNGTEAGIPNVRVRLYRDMNHDGIFDDNDIVNEMDTDSNGDYSFVVPPNMDISKGDYLVIIDTDDTDIASELALASSNPADATMNNTDVADVDFPFSTAQNLTIGDVSVTESGTLVFPVTLSNPSATDTTVTFQMTNGTASDTDYDKTDVTITILTGQTTGTVNVPTTDDTIDESDETMTVSVKSVDAGTLNDTSDTGTGTILDDDGAPNLFIGDVSVTESGTLVFPVTLSNPSATDTTVTFQMTNGTASDTDYDKTDVTITILTGQTTGTVNVPTTDDTIDESDETMTVSVKSVDAGTLNDTSDTGTGTILDDDGAPNLFIGDVSVTESGTLVFPVTLSNPSATDTTVTFQMTNGTASDTDYDKTDVTITILTGQTTGTVNVPTTDDTIDESDETMTVSVKSVDAGTLNDTSDTGTGTILDDDGAPNLFIGDVSVTESGTLVFPVTLSNPSATDTTVTFQMTNGTASDTDYDKTDVTITILTGQTTGTVNVPTTDDTIDESDETMTVSVKSVDAGTLNDTSDTGTGTILDDDGAAPSDVSIGNTPGQSVTVDILANDMTYADPSTVQIIGTTQSGDPLVVPGEGTWTVNPTTGAITFTPESGFIGNPTPIGYTIEDVAGNRSAVASVTITYTPSSGVPNASSDSGDVLSLFSMLLLAIMTAISGLYFIRKEEGEA